MTTFLAVAPAATLRPRHFVKTLKFLGIVEAPCFHRKAVGKRRRPLRDCIWDNRQSPKSALLRQTLLKPKGISTLIRVVWELTTVNWRRERCWQPTFSACNALISLVSVFTRFRIPLADPSGLSKNAAVLQPMDHRFTVTGPQHRKSSFRSPRGRLRYPDQLRRPRWRPSQSCTNIQSGPIVGG